MISTYPFGSAALQWLREHRGSSTLMVTYIPAFHVHPLWAYPGVDAHFVMYDSAGEHARMPGFEQTMRVGAPPVRRGFGDFSRAEAREMLGFSPDDFIVLLTGGAWGLGDIAPGAEALVKLEPPVHVVAVCGKNANLEADMRVLAAGQGDRLTVYGYVSTMAELMAAANVVVTNGAGVTVLEALRTPRPVVAFAPLAGHGTASTAEMVKRDLAVQARDVPELVEQIRRLRTDPDCLRKMERAGESWVRGRDLRRSVGEIQALYAAPRPGPARAAANGNGAAQQQRGGHNLTVGRRPPAREQEHVRRGLAGGGQARDLDEAVAVHISLGVAAPTISKGLVREAYRSGGVDNPLSIEGVELRPPHLRGRVIASGEDLGPHQRVGEAVGRHEQVPHDGGPVLCDIGHLGTPGTGRRRPYPEPVRTARRPGEVASVGAAVHRGEHRSGPRQRAIASTRRTTGVVTTPVDGPSRGAWVPLQPGVAGPDLAAGLEKGDLQGPEIEPGDGRRPRHFEHRRHFAEGPAVGSTHQR